MAIHVGNAATLRVLWYGITVFLSSAIVLVLEIVAARLIAPFVGVSLYTWTSIIGVILAGLSLGNWLGGRRADRGGGDTTVGIVLGAGSAFALASLFILGFLAPVLESIHLDLLTTSFLFVLAMFFVPSVLLGVVTPLLTTLALQLDVRTGHIVGRMHALAALGSILGTFLTGYLLVQFFGVRTIILGSAVCLLLLAVPFLHSTPRRVPVFVFILFATVAVITYSRDGFVSSCDRESNYYCLRVINDLNIPWIGRGKALVLDHLLHSMNADDPTKLVSSYTQLMDELVRKYFGEKNKDTLNYFFAGGGGYAYPYFVTTTTPDADVTVAELDKTVTEVAQEKLGVDTTGMHIIHEDARTALQQLDDTEFDVVITDVFHDISVPYHLLTLEFAESVKASLNPNGLYLMNVVDDYKNPQLIKSLLKTLRHTFPAVDVWSPKLKSDALRMTFVISAAKHGLQPDVIHATTGPPRSWVRVTEKIQKQGPPLSELPMLTDDFVPAERLLTQLFVPSLGI
ncbi:MAG: hypothetical protein AMJ53_10560 [Gammaproteobacteria bacterium SG8_11]|nr:MAG: hypothetical protein AMJ53_10560 [Gammaproteobacteria bacterium SG8_11]